MAEKRRHRNNKNEGKCENERKWRDDQCGGKEEGFGAMGKEKASTEGEGRMAFFGGNEYICFRKMR